MNLAIRQIGNSLGVILPVELLAKLNVKEGDKLSVTETPSGISLSPYDPLFDEQIAAAEEGIRKYRNALRELAK